MMTFDQCFRSFLENRDYTKDDTVLYELMRCAFRAGWQAAGGPLPQTPSPPDGE